jgi:hypothetical protein
MELGNREIGMQRENGEGAAWTEDRAVEEALR